MIRLHNIVSRPLIIRRIPPTGRQQFGCNAVNCLSSSSKGNNGSNDGPDSEYIATSKVGAGLPDFIEDWNRSRYHTVGYGLSALTFASVINAYFLFEEETVFITAGIGAFTGAYWFIGQRDMKQKSQTIRRNFPVLGNVRYLFEMIRPEIRQYFVEADDEKGVPYDRNHRVIAYQRSKGISATMAFGSRRDADAIGYEWVNHSLYPTNLEVKNQRVLIGANNPDCTQPYSSSLLNISAMSFGALSDRAILALSAGARLGGFSHNTGEGGISQFHKEGGADIVWNIGTAYFGCGGFDQDGARIFDANMYAENVKFAKMVEIKLSQGAKPAHGGMLPKEKISPAIAEARNLEYPCNHDCHSPSRHSAFGNSIELCEFFKQLRDLSGGKPIGMKLCIGQKEEFCDLVKAFLETGIYPDFITVDGSEGGTGAAPPEFSNSVGTPLAEGLSFVHALLVGVGLRDPNDKAKSKIALIASGKVLTGMSLYKNFALGADVCNAARSFLFSLGCIQALKCSTNTCPTGITTQDPELSWGLDPSYKQVRVANFHRATVEAVVELMEATGCESWADITPEHVTKRIAQGTTKSYRHVWDHLAIEKGDLLEGKGPENMLRAWNGTSLKDTCF